MTETDLTSLVGYVAMAWLSGFCAGYLHKAITRFYESAVE